LVLRFNDLLTITVGERKGLMDRRQFLMGCVAGIPAYGCLAGCKSVPMTGRKQLMLIPETQEITMGRDAFQEVLTTERPSPNPRLQALVERVGHRIASAANRNDYQWEFRLLQSTKQNAFCLPGGKVAVYEGILPVCQNEAGLAVVMSHEVAHALARHGGERMSQQSAVQGAGAMLGYALKGSSPMGRDLVMRAYGVTTNLGVVLPHSRQHELEADRIGVMLMSAAGYDPGEAPRFWARFGQSASQSSPPEWLSTHPSDQRRASDLEALLPQALLAYNASASRIGTGEIL
jgi:predicted Zn-dependent protease